MIDFIGYSQTKTVVKPLILPRIEAEELAHRYCKLKYEVKRLQTESQLKDTIIIGYKKLMKYKEDKILMYESLLKNCNEKSNLEIKNLKFEKTKNLFKVGFIGFVTGIFLMSFALK